ncbi:hypothetical protein ACU4GD_33195 [Cupriavidus basilensis]
MQLTDFAVPGWRTVRRCTWAIRARRRTIRSPSPLYADFTGSPTLHCYVSTKCCATTLEWPSARGLPGYPFR